MSNKTKQTTTNPYAIERYRAAATQMDAMKYTPVTGAQINNYMNPFQSAVIDTTLARNAQSQRTALNEIGDQAIRAGAFGGSRHGVAEGIARGQWDLNNQQTAAQLASQNYAQALGVAQTENNAVQQYPLAIQQLLGQLAQGTSSTAVTQAPTDWAGIIKALGAAASGGAAVSDRRLKRDIVPIGERAGRKWYRFKYLWSDQVHEGVMAQENMDIAVEGPGGFLMVDYGAI